MTTSDEAEARTASTNRSNASPAVGEADRADPAGLGDALTEWLKQMVVAPNDAALAKVVADVPPHLLHGGQLRYVPVGPDADAPEEDATDAPSVAIVRDGREAGRLWLHGLTDPARAPAVLRRVGGVLECVLETLDRMEARERSTTPDKAPEAYFEQLFAAAPEGIVVLDTEDRVVRANRKFEEMFGYSMEEVLGRTINELIVPAELKEEASGLTRRVAGGERIEVESVRRTRDGVRLDVSILATPVVVRGDQVAVYGIYRDITEQKEAEAALRRLSTTDELTGLLNRRGFFMLAEQQRRLAVRRNAEILLLYIDVDGFKAVNDQYGHLEGDLVLADLADLLRGCYRDTDIVARVDDHSGILARMGGDEFVVLAIDPGPDGERILTTRLQERMASYNRNRNAPYDVSLSIGAVRLKPDPDTSLDALLAAADRKMYAVKRGRTET